MLKLHQHLLFSFFSLENEEATFETVRKAIEFSESEQEQSEDSVNALRTEYTKGARKEREKNSNTHHQNAKIDYTNC